MPPLKAGTRRIVPPPVPIPAQVEAAIAALRRAGSKRTRDEMSTRYGITLPDPSRTFGVSMARIQRIAKPIAAAPDAHEIALALWETGWYEARLLAALVDQPERVTSSQMDRWCRDFDNWGVCDTVCFKLFDRVPPNLAFRKVREWSGRKDEFQKRAAFALLACLALHDKTSADVPFVRCMPLIEQAAPDNRNFVMKGVSWALRAVGRRSPGLRAPAAAMARRLASSDSATPRWIGKDALRELAR